MFASSRPGRRRVWRATDCDSASPRASAPQCAARDARSGTMGDEGDAIVPTDEIELISRLYINFFAVYMNGLFNVFAIY